MFSYVSAFVISLIYISVGAYHIRRMGRRPRSSRHILLAYGSIWLALGFTYFWAGLSQCFFSIGQRTLSREFFLINYVNAFAVLLPYFYFSSYLLWGKRRNSRYLLAAAALIASVGAGLVFSTPLLPREFNWGGTWDFQSKGVILYYSILGLAPVAASLAAFLLYLYPRAGSDEARKRLLLTTISIALQVVSWAVLVTRSSPAVLFSRSLALLSGVAAHLAYFPLWPSRDRAA